MKKYFVLSLLLVLISVFPKVSNAGSQIEEDDGRLSPYFFVEGDPAVDHFPLLKTEAKVSVAGISAEVGLTQVYKNAGKRTIEAVYIFPLGTKSAIHAMKMRIGDRIIEAEIEEVVKAQKMYQEAKDKGQVASLLEQKRPNVFQMKVANIMPGDVVEVFVEYTELLIPEDGIYEFVFPTVVGPRFTGEMAEEKLKGEDDWVQAPYRHEEEEPDYAFNIKVNLNAGLPFSMISVPSHKVKVTKHSKDRAEIQLSPKEVRAGNRDFILRYALQGKAIHTGLLLYPGEEEKFFLLMLEPPEKVNISMVPAREYVFIVDVSGSMNGFPIEVSKTLIANIIENLRGKDYFNIVFFAGGSQILSETPLKATKKNKKKAIDMLTGQKGGGGTRILNAFKKALALKKKPGLSRIIITATDGYVGVEKEVFDLVRENLDQANFFAFGIGKSMNRYIIEGIARVGRGDPFVATNQEEAEHIAARFMEYVKHPLLTDIDVTFKDFDTYDVEPLSLPDLFAQRPLILFGKYKFASGIITVKGKTASGNFAKKIQVSALFENENNVALKYLWAREKIARLFDYGKVGMHVEDEVTELGLKYHLMTQYTAFIAVDKEIRETGEIVTVKQPLPLPEGVSDYALPVSHVNQIIALQSGAVVAERPMIVKSETSTSRAVTSKELRPQLHINKRTIPPGVTFDDIKKEIFDKIKNELEETFAKWQLLSMTIALNVEKGKVISINVKKYKGKKCDEETLHKIFKKLVYPSSLTGTIELDLDYK